MASVIGQIVLRAELSYLKLICKVLTPGPQSEPVFGDEAFAEVIKLKWGIRVGSYSIGLKSL